ncbi:nucleotidyltransferase domain-containing protein [Persephonella sp.]
MSSIKKKNIRLSTKEIRIIKDTAEEIFGKDVKVYIFGSRADLTKKGGDIDVFIETDKTTTIKDEIKFLAILERKGIERKVDLVVKSKNKKNKPIFEEAKKTGVLL